MKKSWKNRSAVSPVIATILMVAITVVLAAVLYVMVMGYRGNDTTPVGALTYDRTTDGYTISLSSISRADVLVADTKFLITPASGIARTDGLAIGESLTPLFNGALYVTSGDYATITILNEGTYIISLQYAPTGNNIATSTITIPS